MTAKYREPMLTKEQIEFLNSAFNDKPTKNNTISLDEETLDEIIVTLRHAITFITSRQKMHKDGVSLHKELIEKLERMKEE